MSSPYDLFAWFYDRYWARPLLEWQSPAIETLLLAELEPGARVLDLCCGGGHLAQQLVASGYQVVGIDASSEMLQFARRNAPGASFMQADAARFTIAEPVDAVVSTFDSVNHLIEAAQLQGAFHCVYAALKSKGVFVFDVNTSGAYGDQWDESYSEVHPDHVFLLRGGFDQATRIGTTQITMFRLESTWTRADVEMRQRPWDMPELLPMLERAGFADITEHDPVRDLGMAGHYAVGRRYVRARKAR